MYSFSKVRNSNGFYEFRNPHFQKGNLHELGKIKRKYVGTSKKTHENQTVNEESTDEKNKELEGKVSILSSHAHKLIEANKTLMEKIDLITKEKEEQYKNLSTIILALIQNQNNPVMMNKIKSTLTENGNFDYQKITLSQTEKWLNNFSGANKKTNNDLKSYFEAIEPTVILDNVSELFESQGNKPKLPSFQRFTMIDRESILEEKSKHSISESGCESKATEFNIFKHAFSNNKFFEGEKYSMLDAYEVVTLQRDVSKVSEAEDQNQEENEKVEEEFEESRKCSLDLFDVEK